MSFRAEPVNTSVAKTAACGRLSTLAFRFFASDHASTKSRRQLNMPQALFHAIETHINSCDIGAPQVGFLFGENHAIRAVTS